MLGSSVELEAKIVWNLPGCVYVIPNPYSRHTKHKKILANTKWEKHQALAKVSYKNEYVIKALFYS